MLLRSTTTLILRAYIPVARREVIYSKSSSSSSQARQFPPSLSSKLSVRKMSVQTKEDDHNASSATKPSSLAPNDKSPKEEEPVEFTALSRSVHVYRPKKEKKAAAAIKAREAKEASSVLYPIVLKNGNVPNAVVIMGWMDAPLRIVTKYAAPYAKLFPEATIIIKLSNGMSFWAGQNAREAALKGVVKVLEEVQTSSVSRSQLANQVADLEKSAKQAGLRMDVDSQNRLQDEANDQEEEKHLSQKNSRDDNQSGSIVIHSFSDGGASNLSQLLRLCRGKDVPITSANIFDCSPGKASAHSGSTAFTLPLAKRPFVRMFVRAALYIYLRLLYTLRMILGSKSWSQVMREHLNSPKTWKYSLKGETASTEKNKFPPRMYMYSKADALIEWRAVEEHAKEAARVQNLAGPIQVGEIESGKVDKSKGIVALRSWEDAKHCDLGRADFEGYWSAVRSFLEASL